jgi:SAM-dependent methyltransferase
MTSRNPTQSKFYGELAPWWPLISPVDDYAQEAAVVADLLQTAEPRPRRVLELGSGGGHNAAHLKARFDMTLVDLAPAMLEVSRALNPECRHVLGDMRTVRLGEQFDAVFVHDAIDHMTTEADLAAALRTVAVHLREGGIAVVVPDETAERWESRFEHGGTDTPDGRAVRYLEWSWDPDPTDDVVVADYVFVLREADGSVRTVHDHHDFGIFPLATWLRLFEDAGMRVEVVEEPPSDDHDPREIFVARRP